MTPFWRSDNGPSLDPWASPSATCQEDRNMKWTSALSAVAFATLVQPVVPANADGLSQLIAAAGLTEAEASGLTLSEIHARKINRETRGDDRVTVSSREHPAFSADEHRQLVAAAGLSAGDASGMRLDEIAAHKVNRGTSSDEGIPVAASRGRQFDPAQNPQLVAAAGLSVASAEGMSLSELARLKSNREARGDERQESAR